MKDPRDDLELLEAWRDGDEAAGGNLFDRYFDALYRFFRNKVRDGSEDLVQATFLSCVASRDRFRGDSTFRSYLFTVARSKLYDHLRSRRRLDGRLDFTEVSVADLGTSPSGVVARREEEQLLQLALQRLPLELQIAIELFYFEGLSGSEVATVLEIAEGTVRSRLRRALAMLRQVIDQQGVSPQLARNTMSLITGEG